MKPTRQETVRRYGLLGLGLLITAFGIAFSIQAGLGTSPISSLPYVVSLLTPLSVGTATICLHGVLILLQLLILRRRYDPVQLLQLPVALVFGYLTDLGVWVIQGIPVPSLWGAVAAVPGGGVPGGRRGGPGSGGRGGDPGRGGVRAGGVPGDPLSLWEPEGGL